MTEYEVLFWVEEGRKLGIQDKYINHIVGLFDKYGVIGTVELLDRECGSPNNESALFDMNLIYEMLGSVCSHIDIYEDSLIIYVHKQYEPDQCWCVYV